MRKEKILEILENAKDGNGAVPMRLVRQAFDKLPEPCEDTISRQAAIRWVKTECNPYGKPTLDFESGKRVMKHLEQMPPARPEYEPVTAEDFAKTMSETSVYSYMLWHSEALMLMERQGFVICKKTM